MGRRALSRDEAREWTLTGKLPAWASETAKSKEKTRSRPGRTHKPQKRAPVPTVFLGIDGEGQSDRQTGAHKYTLLAAADESGNDWHVKNPEGLSTDQCLEFITAVGKRGKLFAYSFGYDLTKILEEVDNQTLYLLFRPELRKPPKKESAKRQAKKRAKAGDWEPIPVTWPEKKPRWKLNYLNGKFTVSKALSRFYMHVEWGEPVVVHDIWRFFQGKFTSALDDWRVPRSVTTEARSEILRKMREMKDQRADFDRMGEAEIYTYCVSECQYMAELAHLLTQAHIDAGIPLKSYYGAGSSATAMLGVMGVKDHVKASRERIVETPAGLDHAIACGFFGGRFENSVIGQYPAPLWGYDISSAYPYQITFLPCLIHGKWEWTRERKTATNGRAALIRYKLHAPQIKRAWAPFPFRSPSGAIVYPESGQVGWVWREEFLAGERLFPNAEFLGAWVYHCDCDKPECSAPFREIPTFYRQRLAIGKEGPGIVLKLGTNSCYGKTAQFIGSEPGLFTSWFWAGMITSGCRAQILDAMARHRNLDNLLMIATDGIISRERLTLDIPRNTGTSDCLDDKGKVANKPLGGWEEAALTKPRFFARPGIYFPLNPSVEDAKKVRARGIGRSSVFEQWDTIVASWERGEHVTHVKDLSRFVGAKTGISIAGKAPQYTFNRSDMFGRWIKRPVRVSFNPLPKRGGFDNEGNLSLRVVRDNCESAPYRKGVLSKEAERLRLLSDQNAEQPDGGDLAIGDDVADV